MEEMEEMEDKLQCNTRKEKESPITIIPHKQHDSAKHKSAGSRN
jgi:hypothetical protein